MKRIPIGSSDFIRIRSNQYYYVDKTMLIAALLDVGSLVTLITRPHRFGKTLNMTTIKAFFDITENNQELFSGLNYKKLNTNRRQS